MQLSDISVKRPVFAAVLAMLMAVIGIVGFFALSVREYPDVDPPVVSVQTTYTGAAANVIETRITEVLEDQLAGIAGLQTITSRSQDGQSNITHRVHAGRATSTSPPMTCATASPPPRGNLPDRHRSAGGAQGRCRRRARSCSLSSHARAGRRCS